MPLTREQLPNDPEVLRAMILSLRTDLERAEQERMALADSLKQITELQADIDAGRAQSDAFPAKVARLAEQNAKLAALVQFLERERDALKHRLSVFLRNNYGRKSEKLTPGQQEIDFPGLAETLISGGATAGDLVQVVVEAAPEEEQLKPSRPIRQAAFDESLPLEDKIHDLPKPEQACDKCGQALIQIDSVDSVQIEFVPATFKRLRHRRLKYACKACGECVKLAARPEHAIMKGLPGPGLLAQTLIAKYDDHQPLNRQEEIYERHGAHVPRSTLCDWVRQSCMPGVYSAAGSGASLPNNVFATSKSRLGELEALGPFGTVQLDAFKDQQQLGVVDLDAVLSGCGGEGETALLQALVEKAKPRAIPEENFHAVLNAVSEDEKISTERIAFHHFFDQRSELVEALALMPSSA